MVGRILFAVSCVMMGALGIAFHDFTPMSQMVPKGIAGHDAVTAVSGVILLAGGLALLVPRTARIAALVLTALLLLFELWLRVPPVVAHPLVEGTWYGVSETLTLIAGAWTIFSSLPARPGEALATFGNLRLGQILFGLALPAIGLSHFFYLDLTAPIIPSWLPFHVPLAYFTGAAHFAAGIGILLGILPRLAATLEAVMVSLFTLLVWVPVVIATPARYSNWTEISVSLAITGAAWAVAASLRDRPWSLRAVAS
ncbi:MAG TPA: hypothetical protein VHZ78_07390 [Rhizomicrobium sp.]|nr:hypothetical protein [Rhizomicrobium sp.]